MFDEEPEFNPALDEVKQDLFEILGKAPMEANSIRWAVFHGRINGNEYIGECCCIKGIIAKNNGINIEVNSRILNDKFGIKTGIYSSPLEQYILDIRPGMRPENCEKSQQLLSWLDEFIAGQEANQSLNLAAAVQAGLEEVLAAVAETPELVQV